MFRRRSLRLLTSLLVVVLTGCAGTGGSSTTNGKLQITTTTGMIADLVQNIGGEHVQVTALMGPGVDPHLHRASEGDIAKLQSAQIIFYNGLMLEGKMTDIFVRMARTKPTVAISERIPSDLLMEDEDEHDDPHIWFDLTLWMKAAEVVRDSLIELDPNNKTAYETNTKAYVQTLQQTHEYAKQQLALVPKERRVLVTAHDAFGYFGRAYDLEVMGLQGISTDTEYGLRDVQQMVDLIVSRKIKAVFVESSVPQRSIEALVQGAQAKGHSVVIGGELFSDAMGEAGTAEGTYIGMVRHNVDTIVKSLK